MKLKPSKKRVVVGMSGGVDSSVAALRLKEQGYDVIGAFIKNWSEEVGKKQLCWIDDRRDAMRVAARLDIPFVTFDFETDFRTHVVDYLYSAYEAGRTPNPDIMCNKMIKFPLLLREAKKLGAQHIATGHYVRIMNKESGIMELYKAEDKTKDQSYFLYILDQEILAHCLFPLGNLSKYEVRKIAETNKLPNAKKPDSQGICFVGEMNMRDFLKKRLHEKPGPIKTLQGEIVGEHNGLFFYTVGQRQGIGIGGRAGGKSEPLYVIRKDLRTNTLVVGPGNAKELFMQETMLQNVHWIHPSYGPPVDHPGSWSKKIFAKTRYRAEDAGATLYLQDGRYRLIFDTPERAVTAGQSAVFYDGEKMLGGGIIT